MEKKKNILFPTKYPIPNQRENQISSDQFQIKTVQNNSKPISFGAATPDSTVSVPSGMEQLSSQLKRSELLRRNYSCYP